MAEPVFVTPAWVWEHHDDPTMRVVDVRAPQLYARAHLPGALNVPEFLLKSAQGPPEPQALATLLGRLGIPPEAHVVAYDDGASPGAARLYWVLSYFGHAGASVLDGGFARWLSEERPVEEGVVQRPATDYPLPAPAAQWLVTREDVDRLRDQPDTVILDVRSEDEYDGWRPTALRDGHIPGAVNLDWVQALQRHPGGYVSLEDVPALEALFASRGVTPDRQIVVHCQSGHRASHTFAVLRHLGFERVTHYAKGWNEWGNLPDTAVEES